MWRCCRGQRDRLHAVQIPAAEMTQSCIVGTKVVAPFAGTVRLVDRQQSHTGVRDRFEKLSIAQSLRRDVNQVERSRCHLTHHFVLLASGQRAVDQPRRDPQTLQRVDLVLHQCDQRRDDDRGPFACQTWQLITEALSTSGRHHAQHIITAGDGVDDIALTGPKRLQSEPRQKRFGRRRGGWIAASDRIGRHE